MLLSISQRLLKSSEHSAKNTKFTTDKLSKRLNSALLALSFVFLQVMMPSYALASATVVNDDSSPQFSSQTVNNRPIPAPNPPLGQSCGLDIALVLDNSTSISSGELNTMKSAMTTFTSAFSGTPTQFSVTKFATQGAVVQGFTANTADVNIAINSIPVGGGFTNWQDGLTKAQSTFDPRPSVPNLVIFASDGNPNRIGNGDSVTESDATDAAVTVANSIKGSPLNAHVLALGIGNDLDVANLQAISGPSDVITSNFDNLAADLAELADQLCGGTITTTKLIDQDGNLNTTNDQTPAADWQFDIDGTPTNPVANFTDVNGQTPAVKVDAGSYSVNETPQAGYQLVSATCSGATNNGSETGNSVTGINVASNNIVSCTFINTPTPTIRLVKTVINNNGGNKTENDFQAKIDGNNTAWSTTLPLGVGAHTVSETNLPTYAASSWGGDCAADGSITLTLGQNAVCTITNDDIAPSLTINKVVNNPYGSPLAVSAFPLYVDGTGVTSGLANSQFNPGSHTVSETQQFGYSLTTVGGDCTLTQDVVSVVIGLAGNYTCTLTNTAIQPKLIVKKHVVNDNGAKKTAGDFTMTVSGNSQPVSNFAGSESGSIILLNEGSYSVDELADANYVKTLGSDCSGTISVGQTKTCIVTNDDTQKHPAIEVVKSGPATAHEGDSVTYNFAVTNTGDDGLTNVSISDDIATGETCPKTTLDIDETMYCTASYVIPSPQTADVVNHVTASGTDDRDETVTDQDSHTLDVLHPAIKVVKSGPSKAKAGDNATYNFAVSNVGDVSLAGITVTDSITSNPVYLSGDTNSNNFLDQSETWLYSSSYLIPDSQIDNVTNTVTTCGYEGMQIIGKDDALSELNLNAINLPRPSTCATDSHTLEIVPPAVVEPATAETETLAPTGASQAMLLVLIALYNLALVFTIVKVNQKIRHNS